jgi:hypothetical protein
MTMNRTCPCRLALLACALLALALAAPSSATTGPNSVSSAVGPISPIPGPLPTFDPKVRFVQGWTCDLNGPAEVQGYRVVCPAGTFLDFYVSDAAMPGDHWELKGKNWDDAPNTAVTTSPGPVVQYGVPGRVYTYGANPLDTYVECTYIHGINAFPANSFLIFASDAAACNVMPDPVRSRINRTP